MKTEPRKKFPKVDPGTYTLLAAYLLAVIAVLALSQHGCNFPK
jgi:hypothetical protein